MNRRDFTRLGLAMWLTPVAAQPTLAQMSAEELKKAPQAWMSPTVIVKNRNSPRTYNQINVPRKYSAGQRRFTIFWSWSSAPEGAASRNSLGHCAPQWPPLDTSCQPVWMINPG